MKKKKISVVIPCRNEEKGIKKVINGLNSEALKKSPYAITAVVVDNGSTDKTKKVASELKVKIIDAPMRGKGNAVRFGIQGIDRDTEIVVFIDGDNTYKSYEILRLVEPITSGFADMIVGSRLSGKTNAGSLTFSHRLANWFYTFLIRHFYRVNSTDVLSGFLAIKYKALMNVFPYITSRGFEIEMELNIKAAKMGYNIFSVPITYDVREGESKIETFRDAFSILYTFVKFIAWKPRQGIKRKSL